MFAKILYILVFILVGLVLDIPFTKEFLAASGLLFLIFLGLRLASVWLSFHGENFTTGEMLYMTLVAPKGVATAAVVFILAVQQFDKISLVLDIVFAFILYSIVLASIVTWATQHHHEKHTA